MRKLRTFNAARKLSASISVRISRHKIFTALYADAAISI